MIRVVLVAVVGLLVSAGPATAWQRANAHPFTNAISAARALVEAKIRQQRIPGYVAAVYADGQVVWAEGFGAANVESDNDRRVGAGTAGYAGIHLHVLAVYFEGICERWHDIFPPKLNLIGFLGASRGF